MTKRFFGLILALVLMLGLSPVSPWELAWAEELPGLEDLAAQEGVAPVLGQEETTKVPDQTGQAAPLGLLGQASLLSADSSSEAAEIDIEGIVNSIEVSNAVPAYGETVSVSVKMPNSSYSVWFYYQVSFANGSTTSGADPSAKYDSSKECYTACFTPQYYGSYLLSWVGYYDINSGITGWIYREGTSHGDSEYADLSAGDFVINGEAPEANNPIIDIASIHAGKETYSYGEAVEIYCDVRDESQIIDVKCGIGAVGIDTSAIYTMTPIEGSSTYKLTIEAQNLSCADYELLSLLARDAWGNSIRLYNSQCAKYANSAYIQEVNHADMGEKLFVVSDGTIDHTPPEIAANSIIATPKKLPLGGQVRIEMSIVDESPLDIAVCNLRCDLNSESSFQVSLQRADDGVSYYGSLFPNSCGTWQIYSIFAVDTHGNSANVYDLGGAPQNVSAQEIDMSASRFEVVDGPIAECGDDLTWTLEEGILTISGTGDMWDYSYGSVPWSSQRSAITKVVVEEGVTTIGRYALSSLWSVKSVELPESLNTIGPYAFQNCGTLSSMAIPDGVTEIGEYAFSGCYSLQRIQILASVTALPDGAFYDCSSLNDVTLPEGLLSIGSKAFARCSRLTAISIPDSVEYVAANAFYGSDTKLYYSDQSKAFTKEDGILYSKDKTVVYRCDRDKAGSILLPQGVTALAFGAFTNCSAITSVSIPAGVTTIVYKTFGGCTALRTVSIPEGVTSIDDYAFLDCHSLSAISIPQSVKSLGYGAFYGCDGLKTADINMVEGIIGDRAFAECSALGAVSLPSGVGTIGEMAFYHCANLRQVSLPNSLTNIMYCAFGGCEALQSITIPESVTSIGDGAFLKCRSLSTITIPQSVESLGYGTFYACDGLKTAEINMVTGSINDRTFGECVALEQVVLGEGISSIGWRAFYRCTNLTALRIPASVSQIANDAFEECPAQLTFAEGGNLLKENGLLLNAEKTILYSCDRDFAGECAIPTTVTEIGEQAFANCSKLTAVVVPEGVTEIPYRAFAGCSALQSVSLPGGLERIGPYAFERCSALQKVTLPNSVRRIEYCAFCNSALEEINLSEGLTYIGDRSFLGANLRQIVIPDSVTEIGSYAFSGCSQLIVATLPGNLTRISYGLFSASGLRSISLPASVRRISAYAFDFCINLSEVELSEGLQYIEDQAFSQCLTLRDITLPSSVINVASNAFVGCDINIHVADGSDTYREENGVLFTADGKNLLRGGSSLAGEYTVPAGVEQIAPYAFADNSGLTAVTLPDSVIQIGYGAFANCRNLQTVTLPDSVEAIGGYAFSCCGKLQLISLPSQLKSLGLSAFINCPCITITSIPSGVTEISPYAFCGCRAITSMAIPGSVLSIGGYAFADCSSLAELQLAEGIQAIGAFAFGNDSRLSAVTIPASVTTMGDGVFSGCSGLSLSVAQGSTAYRVEAAVLFSDDGSMLLRCENSKSGHYQIPTGVTAIAYGAFSGCRSLTDIAIPDSVTAIAYRAFAGCTALSSVTIPDSVSSIGESAFADCTQLTTVVIPKSVQFINNYAFADCPNLASVYYSGTAEEWAMLMAKTYSTNQSLVNAEIHYETTALTGAMFCDSGVSVSLTPQGQGETITASEYEDGVCSMGTVADGVYDVVIKKEGCVPYVTQATVVGGSFTVDTGFTLVAKGNLNGAAVGGKDADTDDMQCLFEYLSTNERKGTLADHQDYFRQVADINGDNAVNILDYQALYEYVKAPV